MQVGMRPGPKGGQLGANRVGQFERSHAGRLEADRADSGGFQRSAHALTSIIHARDRGWI
jgi:hypothetical protein